MICRALATSHFRGTAFAEVSAFRSSSLTGKPSPHDHCPRCLTHSLMSEPILYRMNRKRLARSCTLLLRDASGGIAAKALRNSQPASSPAFLFSDRNGAVFARATREFLTPVLYNYVVETTEVPGAPGFMIHF